ncbi:MAG: helix-turn-helix transcriptional regulator [Clostridium sp.]|nr:helix-turn-helix transcriptional regulator [Clostridium sp.]
MRDKRIDKLAANIRAERNRKKISQEEISSIIGLSTRSLSAIENGWQTPSIFVVHDIARALDIDINVLLKDID